MPHPNAYFQLLPAVGLSIEHHTDRVPDDSGWYLMHGDERLGRFRSLKQAQAAYAEAIRESGWKPPPREVAPDDLVARDAQRRNDEKFFEYWYGGVHARRGRTRHR
jgi:hypothetical protein